jgi:hypothetical protein
MKKLLFLAFLFLIYNFSNGQGGYTLKDNNLFGKVKSVKNLKYQVTSQKGKYLKGDPINEDNSHEFYNENGNKTKVIWFFSEEEIMGFHEIAYKEKLPVKSEVYSADTSLVSTMSFYFHPEINLNWVVYKDANDIIEGYHVDSLNEDGNVIRALELNADSTISQIHDRFFDSTGMVVKERVYENGRLFSIYEHSYENKKMKFSKVTLFYGSEEQNQEITYDQWGNVSMVKTYMGAGGGASHVFYEYTYDAFNNWTQRIVRQGKFKYMEIREIEYY